MNPREIGRVDRLDLPVDIDLLELLNQDRRHGVPIITPRSRRNARKRTGHGRARKPRTPIEFAGTVVLDRSVTSRAVVEDMPGARVPLISGVGDGETAAALTCVSGVAAAVVRLEAAPDDSSPERGHSMITTMTAHAPAVIPSHKISAASLVRAPPAIEVGIIHSCAVVPDRQR
jgi:hypothetical protein